MPRIKVTQKHIDNGSRQSNKYCPVALAFADEGYEDPSVGREAVLYGPLNNRKMVYLPLIARKFISRFDQGWNDCQPFEFEFIQSKS